MKDPHYIMINPNLPPTHIHTHTHTANITHPHTLGFIWQGLITMRMRTLGGFMWGVPANARACVCVRVSASICRMCICIYACKDVCVCVWEEKGKRGSAHKQGGRDHTASVREAQFHLKPTDWHVTNPTSSSTEQTCQHSSGKDSWRHTHTHSHRCCVRVDLLPVFQQFHHVL